MARKKLTPVNTQPAFKVNDRRGKNMGALYPTPMLTNRSNYRPRYYSAPIDTKKGVSQSDRISQLAVARQLFASLPDLGGAITSKASWAVGPNSFTPIFVGEDQEWGNEVEKWLVNSFYPTCNLLGRNFDFRTTLNLTSIALDVDGDSLLVLRKSRAGFPLVQIIASHRIRCRNNETIVKSGRYQGFEIIDGVIVNSDGSPIAYRILGDKPEEDYDISAQSCQLLYEPEWSDQYRGFSRISRPSGDFLDQQDIDELLKQGIKLGVTDGVIVHSESGQPDTSLLVGADEDDTSTTSQVEPFEYVTEAGYRYFKASAGEKIETLRDDRPSQNNQDFLARIQRRALFACGWPIELLDPSKVGGASVRLIQDLARKTVSTRQITLEKRAKLIVAHAVATAMNNGFIPNNEGDWWNWTFTRGSAITVDNGNESNADREGYKLGTTSLSEIASKKGLDWQELRKQNQREVEDLIDRAQAIAKSKSIPFSMALTLLQQSTPNQAPVQQPIGQTPQE